MSEYMLSINIRKLDEGGYLATSDTIQGLIAQGRTISETMEIAQDVARKLIESYLEHGDPLPEHLVSSTKLMKNVKIPPQLPFNKRIIAFNRIINHLQNYFLNLF